MPPEWLEKRCQLAFEHEKITDDAATVVDHPANVRPAFPSDSSESDLLYGKLHGLIVVH